MSDRREFDIEVFQIVSQVLAQPMSEREQFLDELCAGQEKLRKACGAFVNACQDPNSFLEAPAMGDFMAWARTITQIPAHEIPKTIGAYRVIDRLGQGGMGQVFRVKHPGSNKHYALKMLMTPNQDRRLLARFLREQKAHALMNHTNIPGYHDSGLANGNPFFLMDYVHADGNLIEFIKQRKLNLGKRLDLFLQLCDGIAHAHRRMVIHRDLKPSNVLVENTDDKPLVKIVDFGIAAEVGADLLLEAQEARTIPGTIIGTWIYIAPEMLETSKNQVAIDVFGLGMMLFEMVTGEKPRDGARMQDMCLKAVMAYIQEPVVKRGDHQHVQHFDTRKQTKMPLDLKRILAKATHPDPDQRYADVGELVADVVAYQQGRPLRTQYTPVLRRIGKHVMRFKMVSMLAVALLALAGNVIYKDYQAQKLVIEKTSLEQSVSNMSLVLGRLEGIADGHRSGGRSGLEKAMLDLATRVQSLVEKQPADNASLMAKMASLIEDMGQYQMAIPFFQSAATAFGKDTPEGMECERRAIYLRVQAGQYDVALGLMQQFHEKAKSSSTTLLTYFSQRNLATIYRHLGQFSKAEALLNDISKQHISDKITQLEQARTELEYSRLLTENNRTEEALRRATKAWHKLESILPDDHSDIVFAKIEVAVALGHIGDLEQAYMIGKDCLDYLDRHYGPFHPQTAFQKIMLAGIHNQQKEFKNAKALAQESVFVLERVNSQGNTFLARAYYELGYAEVNLGDLDSAERAYKKALTPLENQFKPHRIIASAMNNLADVLLRKEKYYEAEFILTNLDHSFSDIADKHIQKTLLISKITMAETLYSQGKYEKAIQLLEIHKENFSKAFTDQNFLIGIALLVEGISRFHLDDAKYESTLREGLLHTKDFNISYNEDAIKILSAINKQNADRTLLPAGAMRSP